MGLEKIQFYVASQFKYWVKFWCLHCKRYWKKWFQSIIQLIFSFVVDTYRATELNHINWVYNVIIKSQHSWAYLVSFG